MSKRGGGDDYEVKAAESEAENRAQHLLERREEGRGEEVG